MQSLEVIFLRHRARQRRADDERICGEGANPERLAHWGCVTVFSILNPMALTAYTFVSMFDKYLLSAFQKY